MEPLDPRASPPEPSRRGWTVGAPAAALVVAVMAGAFTVAALADEPKPPAATVELVQIVDWRTAP